jgi:excisionase family DNA binding protein
MTEAELPDVMNVDELAAFLRVNRKTVYDAIKFSEIPASKVRGVIRIHKTAMLSWLGAGEVLVAKRKRTK